MIAFPFRFVMAVAAATPLGLVVIERATRDGDHGGAGLGGGAYNDASSTLTLYSSKVTKNHADGSPGKGGGVYNALGGTFNFDVFTSIKDNHASTSNDNVFG